MKRLVYQAYRFNSSALYWARRRLTPAGWIVAITIILTAGMATDAEQSVGYQAFTLLVCMALVAMVFAPFFRFRFRAERLLPRFGTAGQPLQYTITVKNLTRRIQPGLTVHDDLADPRPTFDDFLRSTQETRRRKSFRVSAAPPAKRLHPPRPQPLATLLPGDEASVELRLIPQRRGVLHFGSISVSRTDPLLLFRGFVRVPAPASITILPRRYPLPNLALPGASRYQRGGVSFASSVGESDEFVAMRDYRQGDPLRRIHWRSWAKVGRPVVKEFQDEFFVRHALILDTFTDPDDVEVFEEAVSLAASFACTIDTQETLLDLLFVGPQAYCFTAGRGLAHADQMLEILASVQTCSDKPFEALQQVVIEHSAIVSGCICIFLAWDEKRQQLVQRLEALGVPLLIMLVREKGAAPLGRTVAISSPVHELAAGSMTEDLQSL